MICQPYFNNPDQTSYVMYFEYLTEWLNNTEEYTLPFIRRGVRLGIDVTQPYYTVVLDGIWNPCLLYTSALSILIFMRISKSKDITM